MVNTRTDAELAAAVQAAVDAMLPQIREQVPREYPRLARLYFEGDRASMLEANKQAKGGDAGFLTLSWAEFQGRQARAFMSFISVYPYSRNFLDRLLHCRGAGKKLSLGLHKSDPRPHNSVTNIRRLISSKVTGNHDRRNDRHGTRQQGGTLVLDATIGTGVSSPTELPTLVIHLLTVLFAIMFKNPMSHDPINESSSQQNKAPSEGYTYPVCTTCGRRHPGECRRAAGTCFKCGQAGHLQRDCKKNTGASSSGYADKKPDASGRVFALTQDQAANATGTITGTLFIFGRAVFVLFDTGATHSVISTKFASCLTMTPVPLDHVLCISTPMKDSARITHVYRDLPLQFNDKIRSVDALPLDMCEFDIILGMDWLSAHHATIDCHSRRVIFGNIHTPEFIYHGFLANIHDTTSDVSSIHDQPIVSEFQDVFPEELPGIPPIRDVEFNIELIPGASPISKAPYRMAPIELKELKDQLQELLERGFIRPSVSPWGAPVLFVKKKDGSMRFSYRQPELTRSLSVIVIPSHVLRFIRPASGAKADPYDKIKLYAIVSNAKFGWSKVAFLAYRRFVDGFFTTGLTPRLSSSESIIRKANVVADALSRKSGMIAGIKVEEEIIRDLERLDIELCVRGQNGFWASLRVEPNLISQIKAAQKDDGEIWAIIQNLDKQTEFHVDSDGILWQGTKLCVPEDPALRENVPARNRSSTRTPSVKSYPIDIHFSRLVSEVYRDAGEPGLKFSTLFIQRQNGRQQRTIPYTGDNYLVSGSLGPEMIEVTNEKVAVAREKLKEAQTRQKSYADKHRRLLEFQPGEHVFLKVSPTRGVRRFGIKGKLSPRFIGPFEILERVGYKYHHLHVVSYPFGQIREDLSYTEEPESILDRQVRVMRKKTIPFVKILWRNHPEREATWETEESIRASYPHFLP
ncbi:putative reverse transcriptase domain-containing protein [Tanacetum coccineum]